MKRKTPVSRVRSGRRPKPVTAFQIFAVKPTPEKLQERQKKKRDKRIQTITAFYEEQKKIREWIHLHGIAAHCSETAEPTLPPDEKEDLYINVLLSLLESALAGEFVIDGKSRLLRVHYDYEIESAWLIDPKSAPSEAFVSPTELKDMVGVPYELPQGVSEADRKRLTSKGRVARYFIANCWIPRELAVRWLKSRRPPITIPAAWNVHPERSTKRRPAQNNIREELAQKAPQYLDGPHDQTCWAIAETLVGKTTGANKRAAVDKKRKALERHYAASKAASLK